MPPSTTPGRLVPRCSSLATPTWPLPTRTEAPLSQVTCNPLLAGEVLRGFLVHFCCGLSCCSPPRGVWPGNFPAVRPFASTHPPSRSPLSTLHLPPTAP